LIRDNTRKRYPRPGPGAHFMSEKIIKKLPEEKRDLMGTRVPKTKIKENSSALAKRNFHLVPNPKDSKAFPAPNAYHPWVN
jgi:hypothetical protein